MAIVTFDNFVDKREIEKAVEKFGRYEIRPILAAAAASDPLALGLVFYLCRATIAATFFKYFLGDKKYWRQRINAGDDVTWASEVFERLPRTANSFLTAPQNKRKKASELPETEVLKLFRGYLYMRLKALAIHLNTTEGRSGVTGLGDIAAKKKAGKNVAEPTFVGFKGAGDEADTTGVELSSPYGNPAEEYEQKDTVAVYVDTLRSEYPDLYRLMALLMKGYSKEQVWTKLEIKPAKFYAMKRDAEAIFKKYTA